MYLDTCDTETDSYDTGSVIFDECFDNGTHSVVYDCGDDGATPSRNLFANLNCSGDAIEMDSADECECDDGECRTTVVDNVCMSTIPPTTSDDSDSDTDTDSDDAQILSVGYTMTIGAALLLSFLRQ